MRLPIRARVALFGSLVVCGTVALFGLLLVGIVRVGALRTVDTDLVADRAGTTFHAVASPDGSLRVDRMGGAGTIPTRLPPPLVPGLHTYALARGEHVRAYTRPQPDGTAQVTGENL